MAHKLFNSTNSLTVAVYTALATLDVGCAWRFVQLYEPLEPQTHNLEQHLHALNKFWREQLSSVSVVDTIGVRANLIDAIELEDWIRLFAQHVAPVVVSMDLPQPIDDSTYGESFRSGPYQLAGAL